MTTNTYGTGHDVSTGAGIEVETSLTCTGDYQDASGNIYDCTYDADAIGVQHADGSIVVDCPLCGTTNYLN